jgi:CheY-like chemotaxis protein
MGAVTATVSAPALPAGFARQLASTQPDGKREAVRVSALEHPPLEPMPPLEHSAGTRLEGRTVLVVDDDFHNIFALSALLKRAHVEVISAESGRQGVARLEQRPNIDLVLVDIMMPELDGYATMRAMRGLPSGGTIPLVAFTARAEAGERQRCIDAGASAYVPKPVNTVDLLRVLGEWLPAPPTMLKPANASGA